MRSYISVALVPVISRVHSAATCASPSVDLSWHPSPIEDVNSLSSVEKNSSIYGFIFNSSSEPVGVPYGTYNWCNMPHVRSQEYKKAPVAYKLEYVEVVKHVDFPKDSSAHALRFNVTTNAHPTLQTHSHTSHTHGNAKTRHFSTTATRSPTVMQLRSTGKSTPHHLTLSPHRGSTGPANSLRSPKAGSKTRGSMERIFMAFTIRF